MHATIPKGIVGGFEGAVLQRNLAREAMDIYMFESAKVKAIKVGTTATYSR